MPLNQNFTKKLQKIVDPFHFRFIVVFYGHSNEIDEVKNFLKEKYKHQTHLSLNVQNKAYVDIAEKLYTVDNGFVYIDEMREVLTNEQLSSGFNQRRDKLASKNMNLIMFYHKDNEKYLQRDAVKAIPDLWEFRSPIITINSTTSSTESTSSLENVLSADFSTLGGLSVESKINEIRRLKKSLESINSKELLANTYMQLGILNRQFSNNSQALEYYEQVLKIRVEIGDKSGEGTTLNNISQIYDARGDLTKALEYLEKSLKIRVEIGDKSGEGASRFNIGHIHLTNDEVQKAQSEWLTVYEIAKEIEYAEVLDALDGLAVHFGFVDFEAWREKIK